MEKKNSRREITGKRVLVLGLGISGRSAAAFLLKRGAIVHGVDKNDSLLSNNADISSLRQLGLVTSHTDDPLELDAFDLVILSPGIPPTDRLYLSAKETGIEMIGEVELAFRFMKNRVLGITGTNGKTTVTLLTAHVLNQSGKLAYALGNSGVALTSETAEKTMASNAIVVAELSSYQLETLYTPCLDSAVLLNITPDHLDRYSSMQEYAKAKMLICRSMKSHSELFMEKHCFDEYLDLINDVAIKTYGFDVNCFACCDGKSVRIQGNVELELPQELRGVKTHDVENLMASYLLCRTQGVTPAQFLSGFATFHKPAHRIQFVRKAHGVAYYDDSKGTNLDAVIRAVQTMPGKVILIAGGVDKGAAYTPWIAAFADKVKCICVIGEAAPKIERDLSHAIIVKRFDSLENAVAFAAVHSQPGENVLLSPGCSSFDMFKDYAHRGMEFQRIVNSL